MQIKWLTDFQTLAQTRSFTRAAELSHVTQPAFGRRIKALESWVGAPLVQRKSGPVTLTRAGERFLEAAQHAFGSIESCREELRHSSDTRRRTVIIATGASLARTTLSDWLVRLSTILRDSEVCVLTRPLSEAVKMLEQHEVDFSIVIQHAVLAGRLDARRFNYLTMAADKLVPVSRTTLQTRSAFVFGVKPVPYLAYANSMAMGRLVDDYLSQNPTAPRLHRRLTCESSDAILAYVLKGLGVAWLPWSMVQTHCKAGHLAVLTDKRNEIHFEIRIYRPKRRLSPLAEQVWQAIGTY